MICQWQAYINLLPHWMRKEVEIYGKETLQELRMRTGQKPEMILKNGSYMLSRIIAKEDISFVINGASSFSPWTANTIQKGFITAPGGHRIGICGSATMNNQRMAGISLATSLCIRVARDFDGIAKQIANIENSMIIIGPPGSGKTTLLRDLVRQKSDIGTGSIAVVDEREEIFPLYKGQACFPVGMRTDVLSCCDKEDGINAVLRSMNPEWIAVDEITSQTDTLALMQAGWCGVHLLATAHAGSLRDYLARPIYKPLIDNRLFANVIVLQRDKSWKMERISV